MNSISPFALSEYSSNNTEINVHFLEFIFKVFSWLPTEI